MDVRAHSEVLCFHHVVVIVGAVHLRDFVERVVTS
jgi:hypothetical protein